MVLGRMDLDGVGLGFELGQQPLARRDRVHRLRETPATARTRAPESAARGSRYGRRSVAGRAGRLGRSRSGPAPRSRVAGRVGAKGADPCVLGSGRGRCPARPLTGDAGAEWQPRAA